MTRYATTFHDTPVGDVLLAFADERLLAVRVLYDDADAALEQLSLSVGSAFATDADSDARADEVRRQLDEYFDGSRRAFDLALDWSLTRGFGGDALRAIQEIPYGETASYGEVAILAGSPGAARAVGTACATSPFSLVVPVHRVIRADGSIGEYGGHPETKAYLLRLESGSGA